MYKKIKNDYVVLFTSNDAFENIIQLYELKEYFSLYNIKNKSVKRLLNKTKNNTILYNNVLCKIELLKIEND